jgi:hypothetical protein
MQEKSKFLILDDQIDSIESKLKDKNYRGHGKSCLRMENHTNGTAKSCKYVVPFA